MDLNDAHKRILYELETLNYPEASWVEPSENQYDVAIIGAGMAGLAAAFALTRLGIIKIKLFDQSPKGYEGPWATCARMPTLRSTKELLGPALDLPSLSPRAWYEASFGEKKWQDLYKMPTCEWMDFLRWFAKELCLPLENEKVLTEIKPKKIGIDLQINEEMISARKVVLATGRAGFGGLSLPSFASKLPKEVCAHTNEKINFESLEGKKVGILGVGASGFDAASYALQAKASVVEMIARRPKIPSINKAAHTTYSGFTEGYYGLSDQERLTFMSAMMRSGAPPPVEALDRVKEHSNFSVQLNCSIENVSWENNKVVLETSKGKKEYDFLIFATGFLVDGEKQPEIAPHMKKIRVWGDQPIIDEEGGPDWFKKYPYLGPHFELQEKEKGDAPYLKDIYCFNYGATLSHGLLSSDIPGIGTGAWRLARGIAADLFKEDAKSYYWRLRHYEKQTIDQSLYPYFVP